MDLDIYSNNYMIVPLKSISVTVPFCRLPKSAAAYWIWIFANFKIFGTIKWEILLYIFLNYLLCQAQNRLVRGYFDLIRLLLIFIKPNFLFCINNLSNINLIVRINIFHSVSLSMISSQDSGYATRGTTANSSGKEK